MEAKNQKKLSIIFFILHNWQVVIGRNLPNNFLSQLEKSARSRERQSTIGKKIPSELFEKV